MKSYKPQQKIFTLPKLLIRLRAKRAAKKKIVFTNGCFDLLHVGHVRYLQQARALGDELIVGINSDDSVKRLKGSDRPIVSELERAEVLAGLECVNFVTFFSESTPESLIRSIRPDVLVKGGDWKVKDIIGGEFVQAYGGKVLSLAYIPGRSTTDIIQKIQKL